MNLKVNPSRDYEVKTTFLTRQILVKKFHTLIIILGVVYVLDFDK